LDKAPDAFRTISEVADDLDIPQHVLRFWETRFVQIKPMKRSGGRRYYRPDDVDLLRGIRRLLYGEGYTIRGVQRILKEHGIKSVQGLMDGSAAVPSFGVVEDSAGRGQGDAGEDEAIVEAADDEDEADEVPATVPMSRANPVAPAPPVQPVEAIRNDARKLDTVKLQAALQDLIACRQLLDSALKEG
jgi:DNA-binding transcriptional MerR regulator